MRTAPNPLMIPPLIISFCFLLSLHSCSSPPSRLNSSYLRILPQHRAKRDYQCVCVRQNFTINYLLSLSFISLSHTHTQMYIWIDRRSFLYLTYSAKIFSNMKNNKLFLDSPAECSINFLVGFIWLPLSWLLEWNRSVLCLLSVITLNSITDEDEL